MRTPGWLTAGGIPRSRCRSWFRDVSWIPILSMLPAAASLVSGNPSRWKGNRKARRDDSPAILFTYCSPRANRTVQLSGARSWKVTVLSSRWVRKCFLPYINHPIDPEIAFRPLNMLCCSVYSLSNWVLLFSRELFEQFCSSLLFTGEALQKSADRLHFRESETIMPIDKI